MPKMKTKSGAKKRFKLTASGRVKAGDLVNFVATQVGGKGGGRPDMAQAGGNDPSGLAKALADVPAWVQTQTAG